MNRINLIDSRVKKEGKFFEKRINGSLILTFNINLIFYENWILRKFLNLGSSNNIVFADLMQLRLNENEQSEHLKNDNSYYGVDLGKVFHPKAVLLTNEEEGRLFIGSGNLTLGGFSNNWELFAEFSSLKPTDQQIFLNFRDYVFKLLDIMEAKSDLKSRINRLFSHNYFDNKGIQVKNPDFQLMHNLEDSIFNQLLPFENKIIGVYVISPFYDKDLGTADFVRKNICKNLKIFFNENYTNFPINKLRGKYDVYRLADKLNIERILHAKLIIFERQKKLDILFGSPNFTQPALLSKAAGGNAEIAVLVKNLRKEVIENYLPKEFKTVNPDKISSPKQEVVFSTNNFFIKSSRLTKTGELEVSLWKNLNHKKITLFLNGKELNVDQVKYVEKENKLLFAGIYETEKILRVWLFFEGVKSNVVLVTNEQKGLTKIINNETRAIKSFSDGLVSDSVGLYLLARAFDPFISVKSIEFRDYKRKNGIKANDEKTEIELETEKDEKDFYINAKELDFRKKYNLDPSSVYTFELLKMVSVYKKETSHLVSLEDNNKGSAEKIQELEKKIEKSRKYYINKLFSNAESLSSIYRYSQKENLDEEKFLMFIQNASRLIPFFNIMIHGLEFKPIGKRKMGVALTNYETRELLIPVLEILITYWQNIKKHHKLFKKGFNQKDLENFFSLSLFNLLLIQQLLNCKATQHTNITFNRSKFSFLFSNLLVALSETSRVFNLKEDQIKERCLHQVCPIFNKISVKIPEAKHYLEDSLEIMILLKKMGEQKENRKLAVKITMYLNSQGKLSVLSLKEIFKKI